MDRRNALKMMAGGLALGVAGTATSQGSDWHAGRTPPSGRVKTLDDLLAWFRYCSGPGWQVFEHDEPEKLRLGWVFVKDGDARYNPTISIGDFKRSIDECGDAFVDTVAEALQTEEGKRSLTAFFVSIAATQRRMAKA